MGLEMIERAITGRTPYDPLLTDKQMPEMDGCSLARAQREREIALPIVALTAHAMTEDSGKRLEARCDDEATEPIDRAALIVMCARRMNRTTQTSRASQRGSRGAGAIASRLAWPTA